MIEKEDVKVVVAWLSGIGVVPVKPPRQKQAKAEAPKKAAKGGAKKAHKGKRKKTDKDVAAKTATSESAPAASPEYGYPNLALCVIDAVFSSDSRIAASGPVCAFVEWAGRAGMRPSATGRKLTPGTLAARLESEGAGQLAETVFGCTTRALGCPDLSRAQVVVELCRNLAAEGVSSKDDARNPDKREAIGRAVKATRGFGASGEARLLTLARGPADGASLAEAFRIAVAEVLGREIDDADAAELKDKVVRRLRKSMPGLTEADIVHHLWRVDAGFGQGFTCASKDEAVRATIKRREP